MQTHVLENKLLGNFNIKLKSAISNSQDLSFVQRYPSYGYNEDEKLQAMKKYGRDLVILPENSWN